MGVEIQLQVNGKPRQSEVEPRLFSFNSPYGACPACNGLGTESLFSEEG